MLRSRLSVLGVCRFIIAGGLLAGGLILEGSPLGEGTGLLPSARADAVELRANRMLIEAEELEKQLGTPGLRILDSRPADGYSSGHIPGAVRVDVPGWQALGKQEGGFRDAAAWSTHVGSLGITHASQVVVYGNNLTDTARIWWTLKYLGLQDVRILNGGWAAWVDQQRPTDQETPQVTAAEFEPRFQTDRLEEIDSLKKSLDDDAVAVLDARSTEEFTGEQVRGPRGGHIPGAKHLEWKELLAADGRFKTPAELRELFRQRGVTPEQTAITC